jgi:HSP20 family protein
VSEEKTERVHRVERRTGSFTRTIQLPGSVNADAVKADYVDGVLTITLEKSSGNGATKISLS